jgi:hypothetical protein
VKALKVPAVGCVRTIACEARTVPPPTGTAEVAARAAAAPVVPDAPDEAGEPVAPVEVEESVALPDEPPGLGDAAAESALLLADPADVAGGFAAALLLLFEEAQPAQAAPTATATPRMARRRVGSECAGQEVSSCRSTAVIVSLLCWGL